MNLNKAIIAGRLTSDVEFKKTASGQTISQFRVATNRFFTVKEEKKEEVEFHKVVVFGRTAEVCSQYLKKGSLVLVEGRIQTRSYEGTTGKQFITEIIAENVQF